MMSRKYLNSAKRRRSHLKYRAKLIKLLKWPPEGNTREDKYVATTGELRQMVMEQRGKK